MDPTSGSRGHRDILRFVRSGSNPAWLRSTDQAWPEKLPALGEAARALPSPGPEKHQGGGAIRDRALWPQWMTRSIMAARARACAASEKPSRRESRREKVS